MDTRNFFRMLCCLVALLVILGCNYTSPAPAPALDVNDLNTKVAGTFAAQLTISALSATPTSPPPPATLTPEPSATLPPAAPTFTPSPTAGVPTLTPFLSATPTLSPTPANTLVLSTPPGGGTSGGGASGGGTGVASGCLKAKFVKDVTVPDGTTFSSGETFIKTWRVQNTGSCSWTTDFSLVYVRGDRMSGPSSVEFNARVDPGDTVNLSVNLVAPVNAGDYLGHWMIEDEDGNRFGLGNNGTQTLWVDISVSDKKTGVVYSFVENYCAAEWESDAGTLDCPGSEGDDDGFVILLSAPHLENRKENEPALWMHPEQVKDGYISGTYPPFKIKDDDEFLADIGCLNDSDDCNVTFQLNYRIDGGKIKTLGEWDEVYDGSITRIVIDLSDLAGKEVEFILTVLANGSFKEDNAFWLFPHIDR